LKALGWNQDQIIRYEELFEYSQRWGLANLEREDRQFLKKAEKILPKKQLKKTSIKKSIEEKSYYKWLRFYLDRIIEFDKLTFSSEFISVWQIILEKEIQILEKLQPVLGLPDTIKAKEISSIRSRLIDLAIKNYKAISNDKTFEFISLLSTSDQNISKSWKSIIERNPDENKRYLLLEKKDEDGFRNEVHEKLESFMKKEFPSLRENL
tara:strand:+ start:288 stop:914 length:627 start_codon:yes stop_codon:yes gene_type:complete